jgi:hypothetical protein
VISREPDPPRALVEAQVVPAQKQRSASRVLKSDHCSLRRTRPLADRRTPARPSTCQTPSTTPSTWTVWRPIASGGGTKSCASGSPRLPRAGNHTPPSADPGEPGCKLAAFLRAAELRCPRESASVVARARSCWRWCSSSKSREFATCSHFLSAAARVGGRSTRSEPSRVCVGTARSFGVECALNAKVSTIRLFANSGKGHDVRIT